MFRRVPVLAVVLGHRDSTLLTGLWVLVFEYDVASSLACSFEVTDFNQDIYYVLTGEVTRDRYLIMSPS